jgi:hypothetical protein
MPNGGRELTGDREIAFSLTADEASVAKAMLGRGDCTFEVAYWFGVAEEEIEQLANGSIFPGDEAAGSEALPPPGPYPPIRAVRSAVAALERALADLNVARAAAGLPPWVFAIPTLGADPCRQRVAVPEGEAEGPALGPHGPRRPTAKRPEPKPERPKYQPPGQRLPGTKIAPRPEQPEPERDRASPIQVRLLMERGGFCRVTLLPRRTPEMPVEIEVVAGGEPLALTQLQEEWFEDVHPADLGTLLRDGTAWTAALADGRTLRWVLSGREVYVLGHHPQLSGFVSAPKVLLGEPHVVLCTANILSDVTRVIAEGGSPSPVVLGSDAGIPDGWIGLRGVCPQIAVSSAADADILNVLRADADLRIVLEGGIRITRSAWLLGHPPKIRVSGQQSAGDTPSIDGKNAQPDAEGYLVAGSADQLGQHSVSCGNISRIYSIVEGLEHWEPWDAYCWSMGDLSLDEKLRRPTICGPLVRAPSSAPNGCKVVLVPALNELLLGAVPGEIERSDPRTDIAANKGIALPWFSAVWATPADILHCDKRNAKLLFVGERSQLHTLQPGPRGVTLFDASPGSRKERNRRVVAWCTAVLNAGRKGLQIEPPDDDIAALWLTYRRCAKSIWRRLR